MIIPEYVLLCGAENLDPEIEIDTRFIFTALNDFKTGSNEIFKNAEKMGAHILEAFPELEPVKTKFLETLKTNNDNDIFNFLRDYIDKNDDVIELIKAYIAQKSCIIDTEFKLIGVLAKVREKTPEYFLTCENLYETPSDIFIKALDAGCQYVILLQFDANSLEKEMYLKTVKSIYDNLKSIDLPITYYRKKTWYNHVLNEPQKNYKIKTTEMDLLKKNICLYISIISISLQNL